MSNVVKALSALGLVAAVAACARPEPEPVVIEPVPIAPEPTFEKF